MTDLEFFLEYGLTPRVFDTMSEAAKCLIDSGDPDQLTLVLFNQIANHSRKIGSNPKIIFQKMADDLQSRLDGPQTPDEFNALPE